MKGANVLYGWEAIRFIAPILALYIGLLFAAAMLGISLAKRGMGERDG